MSSKLTLALTLLGLASLATSSPISKRAGGPSVTPIPSNCTISNPLLCTSANSCPPQSGSPVVPTAAALQPPIEVYSYYLELDQPGTPDQLLQECLDQCYGFGSTGECLSVYHAYNYPAPPLYGSPGGQLSIACIMFGQKVTTDDFEVVPEDEQANYTQVAVRTINCPAS